MKKYLLCLDESGGFSKKEIEEHTNDIKKCIVGGILIEGYSPKWKSKILSLFERWYSIFPISVQSKLYHAVEMGRVPKSEQYTETIFEDVHKAGIKFVIFENDIDAYIKDSNTTYMNLLCEGIIQVLYRIVESEGKPIELGLIVGRRANTAGNDPTTNTSHVYGKEHIEDQVYNHKINERLDIEKARNMDSDFTKSKVTVKVRSDKEDDRLILADHICHFWFARDAKKYQKKNREKSGSISTKLISYYDRGLVFPFFRDDQNKYLRNMFNRGAYADLLYEYCLGNLSTQSKNQLINRLTTLPATAISRYLDNLTNYINNIIEIQRNLELGEKLLKNASIIIKTLNENGKSSLKFEIDVKLLLLAVYNHNAKIDAMKGLFTEVDPMIKDYTVNTSDISYYLMFKNRYAVYLQDNFEFEACITSCEEGLEIIDNIQEILRKYPQIGKKSDNREVYRSIQKGKLLGTEIQAYSSIIEKDVSKYHEAAKKSDMAIKQFELQPDIDRQYQYRAVLEAAAGNYEDAIVWLEKYYGMPWKEYVLSKSPNIFGVMNLIRCADYMMSSDKNRISDLANDIYEQALKYIEKSIQEDYANYPSINILYYTGKNIIDSKPKDAIKYLKRVIAYANDEKEIVYQVMALKARLIIITTAYNKRESYQEEIKKFDRLYDTLIKSGVTGGALEEIKSINDKCMKKMRH